MPSYFFSNALNPNVVGGYPFIGPLSNANTSLTLTLAANTNQTFYWAGPPAIPNRNDVINSGTTFFSGHTVLVLTSTNMNIDGFAGLFVGPDFNTATEVGSNNSVSSNFGTSPVTLPMRSFGLSKTFSCNHIYFPSLRLFNNTMSAQSITIGTDRSGTFMVTNIEHNTPGCRDTLRSRITFSGRK